MSKKFIILIVLLGILTTLFLYSRNSITSLSFRNNNIIKSDSTDYDSVTPLPDAQTFQKNIGSNALNALKRVFSGKSKIAPDYIQPYFPEETNNTGLDINERIYQKSSNFSLIVSNVTNYVYDMSSYFLSNGGRVLSSNINTTDRYQHAFLYVRIPADNFDEANLKIKTNIKKVFSENISSTDETGEMSASKTELDRLQQEKLEKEEELWTTYDEVEKQKLENNIKRLENQIRLEQIKLKSVETKTSWASIKITVSNNERYFKPYDPQRQDLSEVFEESLDTVLNILMKGAILIIQIAVFSLIWLPLLLIVKFLFFRNKPQKRKK
jgi:hypothetical protein